VAGVLQGAMAGPPLPPYQIRRSPRARRVRILVGPDGVEVVAPPRFAASRIALFIEERRDWIEARREGFRRTLARHPGALRLEDGARIPLRGEPVILRLLPHDRASLRVSLEDELVVEVPAGHGEATLEAALERFLRRLAHADASAAIARHAARHDLRPRALHIRGQRTLWGSCTADGVINLNWRLVLAPPAVLDYVVVHELCHLRERHHRTPFWRLVERVLPGYAAQRAWLRANGALLTLTRRPPA
jgi:predicted metal-dependent hydrolase